MKESPQFHTDVLVVGTGPMGSTTALALASQGVRVYVVNRYNWTANSPRAHITNQRTMEVLRDLEVEQEARATATPWELMGDSLFTTSLAGPEIARIRAWGTGEERIGDYLQGSPCPMVDLTQDLLEPILVKNAAARSAVFSFNTEYLGHAQDGYGVTVALRDLTTGQDYHVRAKYLIGADGARSKVLMDAGLQLEGHLGRAKTVYVHFRADLSRYVAHRPSILHWIVTADASFGEVGLGALRAVRPWDHWLAGWGVDPSKEEEETSMAELERKVRVLIGDPDIELKIDATSVFPVNQAYAPIYSNGRVFCGGDAVHRHPPSSGLGSNTSVQDAFNLAWKLAYVIKGYAGEHLLDSYTLERAPVGKQIVTRANQSRLDYGPLNACFRDAQAEDGKGLASGLQKLQDPGPEGVARRKALGQALKLKNDEFNAQGIELNQRYVSGAVLADEDLDAESWHRDPTLYLQATTRPGAKIPHVWLVGKDGRRVSTLDVVGKGRYSLVTGLAGGLWARAAEELQLPFLSVVVIGEPGAEDLYCSWQAVREVEEAGALLVRPDGIVAWRHHEGVPSIAHAKHLLDEALNALLCRPSVQPEER